MSSAVGGTGAAPSGPGTPIDVGSTSVGELIGDVTRDLSTLMRQEIELAKAELKQEATKAAKGAGMLGGAGFAGYMVALFLSIALWWALGNAIGAYKGYAWGALIVALLWALVGAVLFAVGRKNLRTVNPKPERTVETAQQIPQALRGR